MTRAELLRKLATQLAWPDLQETTRLEDDARWDSVAQLDILMLLQRDHAMSVSAQDLQESTTMAEVLDLVLANES